MPLTALALALGAAFLHASWNTLLARARDISGFTALALAVGWCAILPVALLTWRLEAAAVPFVLAGGLLQTVYYGLLAAAYQRAEMSLVYPLARGLAPVLVLFLAVAAVGVVPTIGEVVAVFLVALGVLLVRGLRDAGRGPGALLAVGVALTIAGYTVVDQQGLRHASPFAYLFVEQTLPTVAYLAAVLWRRGGPSSLGAVWDRSVVVSGVLINLTYGLVLIALTLASAASVSAVRESSVVIATALAYAVLHERVSRGRAAGAVLVVAGIGLLAVG
ncbi:MAG TPA: DMT family transporter [Candidatus Limnocylindrales bacterium]|nr:DMT family transporter [Candidatus Limnocylindrales bacterium]